MKPKGVVGMETEVGVVERLEYRVEEFGDVVQKVQVWQIRGYECRVCKRKEGGFCVCRRFRKEGLN